MTTTTTPAAQDAGNQDQPNNGFFINNGTLTGWFTTPDGDIYDIRKMEPREVTDPRDGTVSTIWGGYATARDRDLAAKDAMMQAEFKKTGERPAELFAPESKDIPLYVTLRNRPGKINAQTGKPSYTDIGSFWNAKGRYTVLARDLSGKSGLRFGGNVLAWKSAETIEAERAARADVTAPDGAAARANAGTRARNGRSKTPSADA
ncbi:MAG: hypothetical protein K2X60_09475 [Xanthobacteraceae bacterium]|nr:hypothetical protein [Xanthobacteraceae bacterium]MBX9924935.1 hypothetical protein [Hyphomicrobiaceae bacterium]